MRARAARRSDNVAFLANHLFRIADVPDGNAIIFEAAEISRRQNTAFGKVGHDAPPFGLGMFGQPAGRADHGVKGVAIGRKFWFPASHAATLSTKAERRGKFRS